jgi:hypothetical protein
VKNCWYSGIRNLHVSAASGIALLCYQSNSIHYDNLRVSNCKIGSNSEGDMAAVVLDKSTVVEITNILIEPMHIAPHPAMLIRSTAVALRGVRFEGGTCGPSMCVVAGDGWWTGAHVTIENVVVVGTDPPSQSLVELRDKARDVIVRQVMASKYLQEIVHNPNNNPGVEVSHCTPAT